MQYLLAQLLETWHGRPSALPPAPLTPGTAKTANITKRTDRDFFMTLLFSTGIAETVFVKTFGNVS